MNENVAGSAACAAAICDRPSRVIGAVTVAGPAERPSRRRLVEISPWAGRAADELSRDLQRIGRPAG